MIKRTVVIWVVGLVILGTCCRPAFADQSIGYQQYYNEGLKALKDHDDPKALRCFQLAQIYDPSNVEVLNYINNLEKRIGAQGQAAAPMVSDDSIGYKYYLSKGIEALQQKDNSKAIHYFNIALIFNPDSKEADQYLQNLGQSVEQVMAQAPVQSSPSEESQQPQAAVLPAQPGSQVVAQATSLPQPQELAAAPQPPAAVPQSTVYIAAPKAKMPVTEVSLAQISNNGQVNPKIQIEFNSSVILDGKNIQRFLVVDEGYIGVKILDHDRIEIDANKVGTTFMHIWDDSGRHTIYVGVIFPKSVTDNTSSAAADGIRHSQPFTATYTNDWSTYYSGKNIPDLKRQSYNFNQTLAVNGETPYGFFDTSGSYTDFNSFSQIDTYTIGLSQIPLEGTSNFNLRGFDALRYLSPLTMPSTRLRGAFADVDLMDDNLGLSVSHGQEQEQFFTLGLDSAGQNQFNDSYIDAAKLTLFPKSVTDQYSFNFATAYGADRQPYTSPHVYSIQGQHKFNDYLTLNAEQASDTSHDSSLASLKWDSGAFRSGLNFRDIDKDYATVSTLPSNQGEIGTAWTTDLDLKNITASSFLETYQEHLNNNPDDPNAFNYDANGHIRANITPNLWSDSDLNYVDTPGDLSPRRSLGLNQRISRSFGIWNAMKGTVFGGVGYQNNHSSDSSSSNYDRDDVIVGFQLPITHEISTFSNYEYDWLNQPDSGGHSNPNVVNAGLEYQKQFTPTFSANAQLTYRDELGVQGDSSFLSGEKSVIISSGFAYNPTADWSIFADSDASKVMSHLGNPSYDDFEVHVGVRLTFGGATYWDPLGIVSGVVFKDRNGDGKFGPGDVGIAGVKVKVGGKEAITDKDGRYRIQIRAKGVQVYPVLDTIPGGLMFSTPQSYNVDIIQGRTSHVDFGLTSQTGIYGIVFVDKNGTRIPTDDDKFIGKVKIILDGHTMQKSDSHGAFYFRKVTPGEHTIAFDINSIPLNMVPLVKLNNKIDVAEGTNYVFNIPVQVNQAEGSQN